MSELPAVTVKRRPGLYTSLGTPASIDHVDDFARSTGIRIPQISRTRGASMAPRRFVEKLARFFSAARVVSEFEAPFPVSVHQIHCPRVKGARGKLKTTTASTKGANCSIEVIGVGGSDAAELTFEAADSFETEEVCREIIYSFDANWEHCEIADSNGQWRQFVRLGCVFGNRPGVRVAAITNDACTDSLNRPETAEERISFDLAGDTVPLTRTLSLKNESTWSIGAKLEFPNLGLTLNTQLHGKRAFTTTWEYTLPSRATYVAFRPAALSAWLWRSNPVPATVTP